MGNGIKLAAVIFAVVSALVYAWMHHFLVLAPIIGFVVLLFIAVMAFFSALYAVLFLVSIVSNQRIDVKVLTKVLISFAVLVAIAWPALRIAKEMVWLSAAAVMGEENIPDSFYELSGEPNWDKINAWYEEEPN